MTTRREGLRNAFTAPLGRKNRLAPVVGVFVVSIQSGPWWLTALVAAMFVVEMQLHLYSVWLAGWLTGFAEAKAVPTSATMAFSVGDLMDLCDEHGVPPEKVARMIWGDDDE